MASYDREERMHFACHRSTLEKALTQLRAACEKEYA